MWCAYQPHMICAHLSICDKSYPMWHAVYINVQTTVVISHSCGYVEVWKLIEWHHMVCWAILGHIDVIFEHHVTDISQKIFHSPEGFQWAAPLMEPALFFFLCGHCMDTHKSARIKKSALVITCMSACPPTLVSTILTQILRHHILGIPVVFISFFTSDPNIIAAILQDKYIHVSETTISWQLILNVE